MKDFDKAESMIAKITGGKITPGSGSGSKKGDIRLEGWFIESKQTGKEKLTISKGWLQKADKQRGRDSAILVVFYELRGYPYFLEEYDNSEDLSWKSKTYKEDELPDFLYHSNTSRWVKREWTELADL